jgi:hypothetical protein
MADPLRQAARPEQQASRRFHSCAKRMLIGPYCIAAESKIGMKVDNSK